MKKLTKKTLIALAGAAMISSSVSAGNLLSPDQEPEVETIPVFDNPEPGSFGSIGGGGVALGVLGVLILGAALSSGGGS